MGRREEKKEETRAALREEATRLFAERGFEQTTVREIATAAGVTERTFYRYFDGKEGLLAEQAFAWVELLAAAIRARPADEPRLTAVERAAGDLAGRLTGPAGPAPLWMFQGADSRPFRVLRRVAARPLLRIEATLASAIAGRDPGREPEASPAFADEVAARIAVATLRSAIVRRNQMADGAGERPPLAPLLEEAFAAARDSFGAA